MSKFSSVKWGSGSCAFSKCLQTLPAYWVKPSPKHSNCGPRTGHQVQPPSPFLPGTDPALSRITSCLQNCTTGERKPEMNSHSRVQLAYGKEEYNIQSKRKAKEENCSPVPSPGFTLLHPVLVNTRCINDKFKKLYLRWTGSYTALVCSPELAFLSRVQVSTPTSACSTAITFRKGTIRSAWLRVALMKQTEENRRVVNFDTIPSLKFTAVEKIVFCKVARDGG